VTLTIPFVGRREKPRKANRVETKLARTREQLAAVRQENAKHLTRQMATDDYFAVLVQDRNDVYAAWEFAELKRQEAETVAACALETTDSLTAEVAELRRQLAPFLAAEANANRVDVPPMERIGADQDTESIDASQIRAEHAAPVPLHRAPFATVDPGRVPPSWAREDDTVPVAVVTAETKPAA
jgi:hypothetical protein